jgi:hypothetical protein
MNDWLTIIPVASQVKSWAQAAKGDFRGARTTQREFSKRCVVVSQVRSLAQAAIMGDREGALETQKAFANGIDAVPIMSQIKSSVMAAKGDMEGDFLVRAHLSHRIE